MRSMGDESEINEIRRNIEELEAAENRRSIEGILELVTDDFIIVFHNKTVAGKTELAEWLRESMPNILSAKHTPLRVEVSQSNDMAWVHGTELNKRLRDKDVVETQLQYLLTFRKVNGQWKESAVCTV